MLKILIIILSILIIIIINKCDCNVFQYDDVKGINIKYHGYKCKYTSNQNICCLIQSLSGMYCFPQLIIAGTQKSGTTTLSALVTEIPGVSFAKRKELHYFSKHANYEKGIEHYLKDFQPWFQFNSSQLNKNKDPPIFVESTPFYIASPDACKRISSDLPNNTKIVLLLREPVARSYSEYQMKKRRVEQQNSFLELATKYEKEIYNCMIEPNVLFEQTIKSDSIFDFKPKIKIIVQWNIIEQCIPLEIKQHAHWEKYKAGINRGMIARGSTKSSYRDMLNVCFFGNYPSQNKNLRNFKRSRNNNGRQLLEEDYDNYNINSLHYNITDSQRKLLFFENSNNNNESPKFTKKICLGKFASETLKTMDMAFIKEIEEFKLCAKSFRDYENNVKVLEKVIDRCVDIQMGIASQYIYRSIYVAQIYRCHRYISPNRITIISSETFDKDPLKVLTQISQLINLPISTQTKLQIGKNVDIDKIVSDAMNKNFPKFQNNSGWRYRSEYEVIPDKYHDVMTEFFKPYNKMLFNYMNIDKNEGYKEWVI